MPAYRGRLLVVARQCEGRARPLRPVPRPVVTRLLSGAHRRTVVCRVRRLIRSSSPPISANGIVFLTAEKDRKDQTDCFHLP